MLNPVGWCRSYRNLQYTAPRGTLYISLPQHISGAPFRFLFPNQTSPLGVRKCGEIRYPLHPPAAGDNFAGRRSNGNSGMQSSQCSVSA